MCVPTGRMGLGRPARGPAGHLARPRHAGGVNVLMEKEEEEKEVSSF